MEASLLQKKIHYVKDNEGIREADSRRSEICD